jgi:hypothetical protein
MYAKVQSQTWRSIYILYVVSFSSLYLLLLIPYEFNIQISDISKLRTEKDLEQSIPTTFFRAMKIYGVAQIKQIFSHFIPIKRVVHTNLDNRSAHLRSIHFRIIFKHWNIEVKPKNRCSFIRIKASI